MYLKILIRESLFYVKKVKRDQNAPSNSPRACGTQKKKKDRERKGPLRGIIQNANLMSAVLCAPKFGIRSYEETLHQERCALRVAWDLAKDIYKIKNADKTTFLLLLKQG